MTETKLVCDLCGAEITKNAYVKPDGRGGVVNLYRKYPKKITYTFFEKAESPSYDLCVDCSIKISRFIRSIWWNNFNRSL